MISSLDTVAERLGLDPSSPLLLTALTHSSFAAEHSVESNERLEFLGDAVVDLAIADLIVTRYPQLDEGSGSLVRSRVVNEAALARAARQLELGEVLRVGRGVRKENGAERPSLLADAFEAVVAALYFERGYDVAKSLFTPRSRTTSPKRRSHPVTSIRRLDCANGPSPTDSALRSTK
jgi:ribonuclease-3